MLDRPGTNNEAGERLTRRIRSGVVRSLNRSGISIRDLKAAVRAPVIATATYSVESSVTAELAPSALERQA